jgi:PRTRC genetic system protein B
MDFGIREHPPTEYRVRSAIVLYEDKSGNCIATEHDIVNQKGRLHLGVGRFVTTNFARNVMQLFARSDLSFIPPNVIGMSSSAIAWYEPASIRPMYFRAREDIGLNAFDGIKIHQPPLVFVATQRQLHVFALFDDSRPTLETGLAFAPYFNVSSVHQVCLGSMNIPKTVRPQDTESWTQAFFASEFTHFSGSSKHWSHPGTYTELLADVQRERRFKSAWLKPAKATIANILTSN